MARIKYDPHEESFALVAATEKPITVKAPAREGSRGVMIRSLSTDEGKADGAGPFQDVQVKVIPQNQHDLFGGDVFHTIYGVPTPNTANRHTLPLGIQLGPNEDLKLVFLSKAGTAGSNLRIRLEREILY